MIAINDAGGHADSIDVMEALFGTERWTFSPLSDESNQPAFRERETERWSAPRGPEIAM